MENNTAIPESFWYELLHRAPGTHKYDYGHVLIIGGAEVTAGAPVLAARAALRTGAGLVTVASTIDVVEHIDRDVEEIMTLALPQWNEVERVIAALETYSIERHVSVLVIGPGLPTAADEFVRTFLGKSNLPIVVDAAAIGALHGHLEILRSATRINSSIILTPHSGEYAHLIGSEAPLDPTAERDSAKELAREYNVTVVVKHDRTLVVDAAENIYENTTGNPGLATAGTGDVLTGVVAAMVAQKIEPFMAAKMAVYLHGLAADTAVTYKTEPGMIASDVIEAIPEALRLLDS
jgi:NAD(P)H-hydrate epimerase